MEKGRGRGAGLSLDDRSGISRSPRCNGRCKDDGYATRFGVQTLAESHTALHCPWALMYVSATRQLLPDGRLRRRNALSRTGSNLMAQRHTVE
jgi:hypothetical protein